MFVERLLKLMIASAAVILFIFLLISTLVSAATLVPDEVEALKEIARTLGKKDWNFNVDPCSGNKGWINTTDSKQHLNSVFCDCSFESNTTCHVTSIVLKSQSLPGTLPPELVKLPYLQEFDVTRNYLSGRIPPIWGTMKLVNLSLNGNRISGTIPKEIGNISTLANLTLSFNQLSGTIPQELGNLKLLEKLTLSSNNWTGELPGTLVNLTSLKILWIADSNLLGSIPNFIQNWKNLEKLLIQGSGLHGPIPPGIVSLTKLNELIISDLDSGNDSTFPDLSQANNLNYLILRSCNITGELPGYLASMTNLKMLDVSFNKLNGQIPSNFSAISKSNNIYLTGNNFTGYVPAWMLITDQNVDISYNSFTVESSSTPGCKGGNLNLFASSSKNNSQGIVSCSKILCSKNWFSLHINCGGNEEKIGDTIYEGDTDLGGPSKLYSRETHWSFSSTGQFMYAGPDYKKYIYSNTSRIFDKESQLYMNARVSPLSLTYYGFCLGNGNYKVKLHFAEIVFTDDGTYWSLGRRIFDIYIQGNLIWKDFNIEDEAGGVNKPIVKHFTANVTDGTLEIRFYWAGKGTTELPKKGVYGPLISAISVDPDFPVPSEHSLSVGAIVGIVLAVLFTISLVLVVLWWKSCLGQRETMAQDLRGLDLQTGSFTLRQISWATKNFDAANKIGEGGFGSVYKGNLADGTIIAVKQLSSKSSQGNREFLNEIGMISAVQHPNLVKLYGCCIERNQLLLVYEYMENNSLARALFGPEELQLKLDWSTRHKICIGVARGLAFLHEESRLKIVHRDIKATNILLDKYLNPKISDFGLARLHEEEDTHISTRIAGTFGYMAPEYAMRGYLTDKADVYSFGVVVMEIVSGKSNTSIRPKKDCFCLLDLARLLKEEGKLMELVDSRIGPDSNKDQVMLTIEIALLCTSVSPSARPSMSTVVSMLEGRLMNQKLILESSYSNAKMNSKEISDHQRLLANTNESQMLSMSTYFSLPASSASASDLYPINLTTDYLESRL
ncbi:hypothetical protein ACH5RR_028195 [Cinchona calisaya]|uniref:non-specific serine/threonine protein kinase n=1 Tax=Cinchona calisaya TaxID=153742 RepID=A0ABD2YRW3_9GENT